MTTDDSPATVSAALRHALSSVRRAVLLAAAGVLAAVAAELARAA